MLLPNDPHLAFFRSRPTDLAGRPPLASSLQSFESCLFLIALMRYPHALTTCVSAIESALKARPGHQGKRISLEGLIARAQAELPGLATFPETKLRDLRLLRNQIVHFGFEASDDAVAASTLLSTAFPFLISIYELAIGFDLCDALLCPFGTQLSTAIRVFKGQEADFGSIATLSALGHLTRWSFRESMMSPWEKYVLDPSESYDLELDVTSRLREHSERDLQPAWHFDCPVCDGPETLVSQLDDDLLAQRQVALVACFCVQCGLRLSGAGRPLLNAICSKAIADSRQEIFVEFGIE